MRVNKSVTVTVAGPFNAVTGLNGTQMLVYGAVPRTMCRAVFIQMTAGAAGLGYVMDGIYGVQAADGVSPRIPSKAVATDVTAQLGASPSATQPGGSYGDPFVLPNGAAGVDVSRLWVDGGSNGDVILISYDTIEP